jgi:hypothetical protein
VATVAAWCSGLVSAMVGRIVFLEIVHPGRLVSYFVILVIDFVMAFSTWG